MRDPVLHLAARAMGVVTGLATLEPDPRAPGADVLLDAALQAATGLQQLLAFRHDCTTVTTPAEQAAATAGLTSAAAELGVPLTNVSPAPNEPAAAARSEQRFTVGGGNTRASARRPGGRPGLERRLHGVGDELRGLRVDGDVPAEQHAADDLPGVPGRGPAGRRPCQPSFLR